MHFDVDVLDPQKFGPVIFNNPDAPAGVLAGVPRGWMTPEKVVRLLGDVAAACDIVGLGITEYPPWEAIVTRRLLRKIPLLGGYTFQISNHELHENTRKIFIFLRELSPFLRVLRVFMFPPDDQECWVSLRSTQPTHYFLNTVSTRSSRPSPR